VTAVSVKEPTAVALTLKVSKDPALSTTNRGANSRGPRENVTIDEDELPSCVESPA